MLIQKGNIIGGLSLSASAPLIYYIIQTSVGKILWLSPKYKMIMVLYFFLNIAIGILNFSLLLLVQLLLLICFDLFYQFFAFFSFFFIYLSIVIALPTIETVIKYLSLSLLIFEAIAKSFYFCYRL